jgi:hypothetical protein
MSYDDDFDPYTDPLRESTDDELEKRFRDLEQQEEVEALRQRMTHEPGAEENPRSRAHPRGAEAEERWVLLTCPECGAKNRTSLQKLQTHLPRCGRCKAEVWFRRGER